MKTLLLLYGAMASCLAATTTIRKHQCTKTIVRKEMRDMTKADWIKFKNALLTLQNTPSPDNSIGYKEWDYWTRIHIDNMHIAHGTDLFFPWHRAFMLAFENRLRQIDDSITLPYWDWTFDWEFPLNGPIFSPDYGLDVIPGKTGDCRYHRNLFKPHCLVRDYSPVNFTSWYSPDSVSSVIASESDYSAFREMIEMVPHAIVHTNIGGVTGDMAFMNSPNDPLFFLHHSMVDYIWWIWQGLGSDRKQAFKGDLNQTLPPFSITVKEVLDSSSLCYIYQPFSKNRALIPSALRMQSKRPRKRHVVKIWSVTQDWLNMYHMSLEKLQEIVDRFNRYSGRVQYKRD